MPFYAFSLSPHPPCQPDNFFGAGLRLRGWSGAWLCTRRAIILYRTVLYCTVLYRTVLYCTVLYFTVVYCTLLATHPNVRCASGGLARRVRTSAVLYCTVLYCTVLYCTVLYCTVRVRTSAVLRWRGYYCPSYYCPSVFDPSDTVTPRPDMLHYYNFDTYLYRALFVSCRGGC